MLNGQILFSYLRPLCFCYCRDKKEDQLNRSSRKSIDFDDLNLTNQVTGEKEKGSVIVLPEVLYSDEKAVGEQGIKNQQKFQKENPEEEEKTEGDEEKILEKTGRDEIPLPDSSESSLFTYPKNNRYKNCAENRDDEEDEVVVSSYKVVKEEESSESSLFSLSIDSRRRQSFTPGGRTAGEDKEEVSSKTFITPIPSDDKDKHIDSVLKPIENLNQWEKIVGRKAKSSSTMEKKNQEPENVESEEFMFPLELKKKTSNSCRVDTSLSSWLVESENSPEVSAGNLSSSSLKKTKSSSSITRRRRRSYSFSPNETPILGTVGSYWRHTGGSHRAMDAADSGSSMSGRNQTNPFQTRLEEAMDMDSVKS